MKFLYPAKDAQTEFHSMEFKGMQALAMGRKKEAVAYYDKVILADPSLKTIQRVVDQYKSAGCRDSDDHLRYWQLSCQCKKFNDGRDEYGNFQFGLKLLRNKHPKFIEELQQHAVVKANGQSNQRGSSAHCRPPSYESITEQTALLQDSKPNQ